MNYRHVYHAGNFADCLKHAALTAVLLHLCKKESPFAVIDSHAGRGLYDISSLEAKKTGEAADGIVRLLPRDDLPGVLGAYRDVVRSFGDGHYPGSPLIAAKLLRGKDRLIAIEKQPQEQAELTSQLAGTKGARTILGDGYSELPRLLPPRERRGVILIDPPYEEEDEFARAAHALADAYRRFSTGIFLFWYPAKVRAMIAATEGELLNAGIGSLLRLELDVDAAEQTSGEGSGPRLSETGILAVNPPYGFAEEMRSAVSYLAQTLAQGPRPRAAVEVLAES